MLKQNIKKTVCAGLLLGVLNTPAATKPANDAIKLNNNYPNINLTDFRSYNHLKKEMRYYMNNVLEKNIYYNNILLIKKGYFLTPERFKSLIKYYSGRENIYVDKFYNAYKKYPGFNCYSSNMLRAA